MNYMCVGLDYSPDLDTSQPAFSLNYFIIIT